jgi:hypothetical protein
MKVAILKLAAVAAGCVVLTGQSCGSVREPEVQTEAGRADAQGQDAVKVDLRELPDKLTKVAAKLQSVEARLLQAHRAVPTGEEFRKQVADGRKKIEHRRSRVATLWKEAGRIAQARGVKMDYRFLKDVVPPELVQDAEFLAARKRALEEEKLVNEFDERLIEVMLTTRFADSMPVSKSLPDAQAIALEWENLATHQKSLTNAVQNARAKATAAKVEFDPARVFNADPVTPGKGDAGLIKAKEQAKLAFERREATAELVASLEFRKAVGPQHKNW